MAAVGSSLRTHCLAPSRVRAPIDAPIGATGYGRMFPDLPSFNADESFLRALGRAGGICDCGDTEDNASSLSSIPAGWPFFGQYIAHDITADRSALTSRADFHSLRNARAPKLNLESLYGDGPVGNPFLFQRDDSAKMLLGAGGEDVPRNSEGIAIIGDPRNDSHMLMAQMQLAMMKAHNEFVDSERARGGSEHDVFDRAARRLRWHYQRAILDEFLPSLVGRDLVDEVVNDGPRWFRPDDGVFIPLEFADGAYRYGHCQIRQKYLLNHHSQPVPIFPDLLGFRAVPKDKTVDWTLFFDAPGHEPAQRSKKIDGKLPRSLINLPVAITGECEVDEYHSLAVRDLERGQGVGLPSGEAVARHIGVTPLTSEEVGLQQTGWKGETPLWYYILREAAVTTSGDRLGPVGGRIVAEVIVVLLDRDPDSVRSAKPDWQPEKSLIELLAPSTAASVVAR
jgi:hypothetical protein